MVLYKNKYKILSDGSIISSKGFAMRPRNNGNGYLRVCIYSNGKVKDEYIHRLVATAFIPNPENKKFVNHKNGVKSDNRVENLEWCDGSENVNHAYRNGLWESQRMGVSSFAKRNNHKYHSKKVLNTTSGEVFNSIKQAAISCKASYSGLVKRLSGKITNNSTFKYL